MAGERQLDTRREDPHAVVGAASDGARTNVVSDRFVQRAKRSMSDVLSPAASSTTATGLPPYGVVVKTST